MGKDRPGGRDQKRGEISDRRLLISLLYRTKRNGGAFPVSLGTHAVPHDSDHRDTALRDRPGDDKEAQRAFFGRRKGHPLKPRQAALFETLLPRLALDLAKPSPPICARYLHQRSTICGSKLALAAPSI